MDQDKTAFPVRLHPRSQVGTWLATIVKASISTTIDFRNTLNLLRW